MDIYERIDAAIERITSGSRGLMRVPPDETDPDVVLDECKRLLMAEHRARRERIATAVLGDVFIAHESFCTWEQGETKADATARRALEVADALIRALDE